VHRDLRRAILFLITAETPPTASKVYIVVEVAFDSAFLPTSFEEREQPLIDGLYEVRWRQRYGLALREVTEPHRFTLRNGELVVRGT
jgi:hypothetical protein